MLNEIRQLFRQSVEAFRREASVREPEDQVTELLSAMRRELVAARAALPEYDAVASRARADLASERDALAQCERRGAMASRIGDGETARVAEEFAARHRERIAILAPKAEAAEAEAVLRRREADEMVRRYREADANRFALLAQLRQAGAASRMRERMGPDARPFDDLSRMEDRVVGDAALADALEELGGIEERPTASRPDTVEERLRELKRRMGDR